LTASNKQTLFFFILFSTGDFKEQVNRKLGRRKTFTWAAGREIERVMPRLSPTMTREGSY
jgi:hypothetical protein